MSKFNGREGADVSQLGRFPVATSIDSLCLLCDDVVLAPDFAPYASNYHITKATKKKGCKGHDVILWRECGEPVWGQSAVTKLGCVTFYLACINPCKPPQLSISFSFPRWKWGHNARAVTQDEVADAIKNINTLAADLGLSVDTARTNITRLDLFRDVPVERTFADYLEVLRAVEPPYGSLFKEKGTWILRGSKPNRWVVCDNTKMTCGIANN